MRFVVPTRGASFLCAALLAGAAISTAAAYHGRPGPGQPDPGLTRLEFKVRNPVPNTDVWYSYDDGIGYSAVPLRSYDYFGVKFSAGAGMVDSVRAQLFNDDMSATGEGLGVFFEIRSDAGGTPGPVIWQSPEPVVVPPGMGAYTYWMTEYTGGVPVTGDFYVFVRPEVDAGEDTLFQLLDQTINSPPGTQWEYWLTVFIPNPFQTTGGDIMIRAYHTPPTAVDVRGLVDPWPPDPNDLACGTSTYPLIEGEQDSVYARFYNTGTSSAGNVSVSFLVDGVVQNSTTIASIGANRTDTVRVAFALVTPAFDASRHEFAFAGTEATDLYHDNDTTRFDDWTFPPVTYDANGFEHGAFPPAGWLVVNNDGGTETWERYCDVLKRGREHAGAYFAVSFPDAAGQNDDWLFTGPVSPTAGWADTVGLFYRALNGAARESLEVWAMLGQSVPLSLARLAAVGTSDTTYTLRRVPLDNYDGQTIYLGFRNRGNQRLGLLLDDIWLQRTQLPPPPVVTLTRPVGGETWTMGQVEAVNWSHAGAADGDSVWYSLNGGTTWQLMTAAGPGVTSYNWTVPSVETDLALVRVKAWNIGGATEDTSGLFSIVPVAPTVFVSAPAAGASWMAGTYHWIAWTPGGGAAAGDSVWYTTDGLTWTFVVERGPGATGYSWLVPDTPSAAAQVRVKAWNGGGVGEDTSGVFSIVPMPSPVVTLNRPLGGEVWSVASQEWVQWSHGGGGPSAGDSLWYTADGSTWQLVATPGPGAVQYLWTVPNTPTVNARMRIKTWNLSGTAEDTSGVFTIVLTPPSITVTRPAAGEAWTVGTWRTVRWTNAGGPAVQDSLWYSTDGGGGWTFLGTTGPGVLLYSWLIPDTPTDAGLVRVKSYNSAGAGEDTSDLFSIVYDVNRDVGITALLYPTGTVHESTDVFPRLRIENIGDATEGFDVRVVIRDTSNTTVFDSVETAIVSAGDTVEFEFPTWSWLATPQGGYSWQATTELLDDDDPGNDTMAGTFLVGPPEPPPPGGWVEMAPMPAEMSTREARRGAWLAAGPDEGGTFNVIYAQKGNKTQDFYRYHIDGDSWVNRTGMPYFNHPTWYKKPPDKGSRGVSDGMNCIYVTQGNNSLGWWRYDMADDSWEMLPDVPSGPYGKKVKGGTDLAYLRVSDSGYVYVLKGYRTEFYRYNTQSQVWETLTDAPSGHRAKWDRGSWLCAESQNAQVIYAHKAKYHEFWRYAVDGDSWTELSGMPFLGSTGRRKKSKDGGCAAWYSGGIYALKGGNTGEFWFHDPGPRVWYELDTMPSFGTTGKKKRVKDGGHILARGDGTFYALKGNKTFEFWRYQVGGTAGSGRPPGTGEQADGPAGTAPRSMLVPVPNPLAGGFVELQYRLEAGGQARLAVIDVAGRVVAARDLVVGRAGSVTLDLRRLAAGTYFVRLAAPCGAASAKLVVRH